MDPKYLFSSVKYPYKSKIIKDITVSEGDYEKSVRQLDKEIFNQMKALYIKKQEAGKKAIADRWKQFCQSGKDVNDGTNKFLKKAQRLEVDFHNKYGDFYNDFVRWESGPGIQGHPIFNFDIVSQHPASLRLLNEFSIVVSQYELGVEGPERQYYQRESPLKKIISNAKAAYKRNKKGKNKYAFIYDFVMKRKPELLRKNADRKTEEARLRQLSYKTK